MVGPKGKVSDHDLAAAFYRATSVIDVLLDALERSDPLGLKTRRLSTAVHGWKASGLLRIPAKMVTAAVDAASAVTEKSAVPGTPQWEAFTQKQKIDWWISRIGGVTTILVAYPGVFGALARRVPLQDFLGFVQQVILLSAVLRVRGVADRYQCADELIEVMCHRDLDSRTLLMQHASDADSLDSLSIPRSPKQFISTAWKLWATYEAIGDELAARPSPRQPWKLLSGIPMVGVVPAYVGERFALRRARKTLIGQLAQ